MDWTWGWTAVGAIATCVLAAGIGVAIWQIIETRRSTAKQLNAARLSTNAHVAIEISQELRSEENLNSLREIYSYQPEYTDKRILMIQSVGIDFGLTGPHRVRCLDEQAQLCDGFNFQSTLEGLANLEKRIFQDESNPTIVFEPTGLAWLVMAIYLKTRHPECHLVRAKVQKVAALRRHHSLWYANISCSSAGRGNDILEPASVTDH